MPNINLKYLIIVIVSLSILMVVGALLFNLISSNKSSNVRINQVNLKQNIKDSKQVGTVGGGLGASEGAIPSSKPKPSK